MAKHPRTIKLYDVWVTPRQFKQLYQLCRIREAYDTVYVKHHMDTPSFSDNTFAHTILAHSKANDVKLRRLGSRIWGTVWGTAEHKHHPMSWRNISASQLSDIWHQHHSAKRAA